MYNRISYGSFSPYLSPMPDISRKEFNLLIALLLPTVIFGIFPSVIIETLDIPTTTLLYVTETPNFVDFNNTFLIKDYTEQVYNTVESVLTSSSILLFGRKFKLPHWLKFVLSLLLLTAVVLKLLGISILSIFTSITHIKYYLLVLSSIIIIYILMTIFLLIYFYKNKDINLDNYDYLPEFIFT